ncbi:hypothetical protein BGZ51_008720 [Haplosporangium sp. Z 767]|nr:hypothetical protein BGZ51_008720 [Haplosporangium sp. Z 767]KAF9178748.1 hypothetical protein BGZ50_007513 [Haplosporangium sp. Z 11]
MPKSIAMDSIKRFLPNSSEEILAIATPISSLQKRESMRFEKRSVVCYYNYRKYICPDGYHCIGGGRCKKNANYAWTAVFGVLAVLLILYFCLRRRRAKAAMANQQSVATTTLVPRQDADYAANPPAQSGAPPPCSPNMTYKVPITCSPPAASSGHLPPGSSPYTGEMPPSTVYAPPIDASPTTYSSYHPVWSSYAAPPPGPPNPPPETQASPYSGTPHTPTGQPQSSAYGSPPSEPYPVPQGEASSYAPPK